MRVIVTITDPWLRMHTMTVKKGKAEIGRMKELLAGDDEFIRSVVRAALQEVLEAEMTEAVGAGKGADAGTSGLPQRLLQSDADHARGQARAAGAAGP
jgi:transposase-like protein